MAIDNNGNITLNKAGDASITFQSKVTGTVQDISAVSYFFVVETGLIITPDTDPNDPTTRIINLTPDQLVALGTKTRAYDIIRVVDGKRKVLLSGTITGTGFAVGALS